MVYLGIATDRIRLDILIFISISYKKFHIRILFISFANILYNIHILLNEYLTIYIS